MSCMRKRMHMCKQISFLPCQSDPRLSDALCSQRCLFRPINFSLFLKNAKRPAFNSIFVSRSFKNQTHSQQQQASVIRQFKRLQQTLFPIQKENKELFTSVSRRKKWIYFCLCYLCFTWSGRWEQYAPQCRRVSSQKARPAYQGRRSCPRGSQTSYGCKTTGRGHRPIDQQRGFHEALKISCVPQVNSC